MFKKALAAVAVAFALTAAIGGTAEATPTSPLVPPIFHQATCTAPAYVEIPAVDIQHQYDFDIYTVEQEGPALVEQMPEAREYSVRGWLGDEAGNQLDWQEWLFTVTVPDCNTPAPVVKPAVKPVAKPVKPVKAPAVRSAPVIVKPAAPAVVMAAPKLVVPTRTVASATPAHSFRGVPYVEVKIR